MSLSLHSSAQGKPLHEVIRRAGISGCGGAGFPTYAKYEKPQPYHLTNAQESEPGYFIDKWLHKHRAQEFFDLYEHLRGWGAQKIIIGAKQKDRAWFEELEQLTSGEVLDCTGRNRHDPAAIENPYLFCYTDDRYAFGKEGALMLVVAQVKMAPGERPGAHGFVVNNSQTLLNVHAALTTGAPVVSKLVHIMGETARHLFESVPVGTPVADLLHHAGAPPADIEAKGHVVVEGGPGWYHRVDAQEHVVTRRTNSILVIDPAYRDPDGKDVLPKGKTPGYPRREVDEMAQEPASPFEPERVRVPLVDNPELSVVQPAVPVVSAGDVVERGQCIADPAGEGVSIGCHASISGKVVRVTDGFIEIERA